MFRISRSWTQMGNAIMIKPGLFVDLQVIDIDLKVLDSHALSSLIQCPPFKRRFVDLALTLVLPAADGFIVTDRIGENRLEVFRRGVIVLPRCLLNFTGSFQRKFICMCFL